MGICLAFALGHGGKAVNRFTSLSKCLQRVGLGSRAYSKDAQEVTRN